jgi:hypothetical protein
VKYFNGIRSYAELYPKITPDALDMLKKLLAFNPEDRLTAQV